MATPEALTKYYDCLKDSFNKIQMKDNKTALINAALRPKIREEFVKSKEVLISYLNYIQVFTSIYSDKFNSICFSIICPLFKENSFSFTSSASFSTDDINHEIVDKAEDVSNLVHKAVKEILKTKPELVDDYVHCVIKFFPSSYSDNYGTFINYTENSLEICSYIRGEPLTALLAKILDRANPPQSKEHNDEEKQALIKKCITSAYDLIYKRLETLEKRQLDNVSAAILAAFTREFLTSENGDSLNYLILYVCSLDEKLTDLFINLLWATFTNPNRPLEERKASACFTCSFMSRAIYVDINKVLNYLETAVIWCNDFLFESQAESDLEPSNVINENIELFHLLVHSILYLITQRYRELYEKESIERLQKMDLDKILSSQAKPLDVCDISTEQRFREVATLYGISDLKPNDKPTSARKKRKSDHELKKPSWRVPFKEMNLTVPEHVKQHYRNYYDHRNFTVYRE